jgi:hypothetical protein
MGKVVSVIVDYVADVPGGPQRRRINLPAIIRHCRPERVEDLLDDLQVLCEDVLAGRRPHDPGRPSLTAVREPK